MSERIMRMKVKLDPMAFIPTRAHDTDAGLDIRAKRGEIVPAGGSKVFYTGVHVQIPKGCAGLLVSKSGLNVKHGITSDGLIDEGYTGEIVVKLYNNGDEDYVVMPGDKISQLVVIPVYYVPVELAGTLEQTDRGASGFGSSGK